MQPMTAPDLHVLQHSLGVDQYGRGEQYRNRFVTGAGSTDYPVCVDLVERGLMTRRAGHALTGGYDSFQVTALGVAYVAANSPAPPRLSRGAKRYARFLAADPNFSFGEWLKRGCAK